MKKLWATHDMETWAMRTCIAIYVYLEIVAFEADTVY
jgi:hypothetical protein